jgi:hypothetical protein
VRHVRQRFVEQGLEEALARKPQEQPSRQRILDGSQEAHLIALRCSDPPKGHSQWTLRLLADQLVELDIVESISYETVRQTLKKRAQTPLAKVLGDSTRKKCRLRGSDGRGARLLPATL